MKTGAKIDPPGHKTPFQVLKAKASLGSSLPRSVSYADMAIILAQGEASACTGMSKAGSIYLRMLLMGTPIALPSYIGLYNGGLRIDRIPNPDGSLPALEDGGVQSNQVTRAAAEWGCCSATTWGNLPITPEACIMEPTERQLSAASQFKVTGSYGILTLGDQACVDTMTALANGFPVECTLYADTAFQQYNGGVLTVPSNWNDPNPGTGWHRNYLVGYEWDGSDLSTVVFQGANSWGNWGESGFWRAGRPWFDQLLDKNVMDVKATGVEA